MALEDDSTIDLGVAHILTAPPNTAAPTATAIAALSAINPTLTSWDNFGHTSLDNDFAPFLDGGDSTVKGSRQNLKLRETVAAATEGVDISAIQVTAATLTTYYGGGTVATGTFTVPTSTGTIEKAVVIAYFDGDTCVAAEYHSKASMRRSGPIKNAQGGWLEFPIRLTWLQGTNPDEWISDLIVTTP